MAGAESTAATGPLQPPRAGAAPRRLRADAARNRRTLLEAAEEALARQGAEVSVAAIAETAGLGKATVFRRFPTKDDLVAAVVEDRFGRFVARAEQLLTGTGDAEAALREFLALGTELLAGNHGICESLYGLANRAEIRALTVRLLDAAGLLLRAAQSGGSVRPDVTAEDLLLLLRGIAQTARPLHESSPDLWRRYLDLVWDGLRAVPAHRLGAPAPAFPELRGLDRHG